MLCVLIRIYIHIFIIYKETSCGPLGVHFSLVKESAHLGDSEGQVTVRARAVYFDITWWYIIFFLFASTRGILIYIDIYTLGVGDFHKCDWPEDDADAGERASFIITCKSFALRENISSHGAFCPRQLWMIVLLCYVTSCKKNSWLIYFSFFLFLTFSHDSRRSDIWVNPHWECRRCAAWDVFMKEHVHAWDVTGV